MKTIGTTKGVEKQKLNIVYKSTTCNELVNYLKPILQFKKNLENIPFNRIVFVIDIAENYSFEIQMRCNQYIGKTITYPFLFKLIGQKILTLILLSLIQIHWWSIISTFIMTRNMNLILCSIVWTCIRKIYINQAFIQSNIGFIQMVVLLI